MLKIKCAQCKTKLIKYKKIGKGKVLRCWKEKITRVYDAEVKNDQLLCKGCGNIIGEIKDKYVDMDLNAFTYSGTKISK